MSAATRDDRRWLLEAVELSRRCPPVSTAYSVGAVIVAGDGTRLTQGYSRENDPLAHAEESAIAKLGTPWPTALATATIYSSLEPCSTRRSRPRSCTQLILAAGIGRVVYALREPPIFAECHGVQLLRDGGVEVVEITDLRHLVREINALVLAPGTADDPS